MNYVSKSDTELKKAVEEKIEWCLNIYRNATTEFEEYNIPTPPIKYDLRGRCAGQAVNQYGSRYIRLNWPLLVKYKEEFIERTVVHEIAHIIADAISHPMGCKPHGRVWKSVMRNLGVSNPTRCHNYDTSNAGGRKRKRWIYKCDCRDEIKLSTTKHNKHRTYRARYRCNSCRAEIKFTGAVKTF